MFRGATVLIALATAVNPLLHRQLVPLGHFAAFQDDFFFYLSIARNIANHGSSTFDFQSCTNGYHPLWMVVLTGLATITDTRSVWFVVLLQTITFVLILVTASLFNSVAKISFGDDRYARWVGVLFIVFLYANLTRTGMEVALVVPAMLWAILASLRLGRHPSPGGVISLTFAYVATILSRLDAAFFIVALILAAVFCGNASRNREIARYIFRPRMASLVVLAATPLIAYLALNQALFGMWLPQSGAAKQMRVAFSLNSRVLEFLFWPRGNLRDLVFFGLTATLPVCLGVAALILGLCRILPLSRSARIVLVAANICVVMYYAALALISSWSLWIWYLYPVTIAGGFGAVVVFAAISRYIERLHYRRSVAVATLSVATGLAGLTMAAALTRDPAHNTIHWAALRIADFASEHPGVYAMGDRSGLAGFLLPRGLVQLEGLVSPPSLLELIRAQAPLEVAFERYHVDYYVGTDMETLRGCYVAEEPKARQAGWNAKRMTALLCMPPVAAFTDRYGRTTLIFRVSQQAEP